MSRLLLLLLCLFAFPALAVEAVVPVEGEQSAALVPALVALGAAVVRFALVLLRGGAAAKLGKWGALALVVLSVVAGFLEHLAGGGDLMSSVAVAVSLLGGAFAGNAGGHKVVQRRADRIKDGSIGLGR